MRITQCLSDKEGPGTGDAKSRPQSFARCYQAGEGHSREKEHMGEGPWGSVHESMSLGGKGKLEAVAGPRREPQGSELKRSAWDSGPYPPGNELWKV